MLFSGAKENRALADATISRLRAEARIESAKASLFRIGGYSAFVVCLGLGCAATLLGAASIKQAQSSSHEIANILVKAISNASITTKGEVKLLPGAIVSIESDATVGLNPTASVKLESGQDALMQNTRPASIPSPAQLKSRGKTTISSRVADAPKMSPQRP
jgi:hypothetical protein